MNINRTIIAAAAAALFFPAWAQARQPEPRSAAPITQAAVEGKLLPRLLGRDQTPLCRAMGREACGKAREIFNDGWVGSAAEREGGFVVAHACGKFVGKGACGIFAVKVAVGADGRVWTAVLDDENVILYGDPPPAVLEVLKFQEE